jgi:glycosyltransferase involved in cell wall biosynthesis
MNILFVHQNMPGQYREIVPWIVAQGGHQVAFLTQRKQPPRMDGVRTAIYKPHHRPGTGAYSLSKVWEEAVGSGYGAVIAARALEKDHGFRPDIVVGHVGWGELTFFKQLWPDVPVIGYFEYYYRMGGAIIGFDPSEPVRKETPFLMQARNSVPLAAFDAVDIGQCPTGWQRDRFPTGFHDRMYVCHDGIRCDLLGPDPEATLALNRLDQPLRSGDEVVTYVARNLETVRGFHIFMRTLPEVLSARPDARVLIVGGNDNSYSAKSNHPGGLRAKMEAEVGADLDWTRVHFLGNVPYGDFKKIIQISRCHIYLTMPFVLSWSLLEAMAMETTIVASDVAPVREVIEHGQNGLLVDFHDPGAIAKQVIEVLASPEDHVALGAAARRTVLDGHDFQTRCLPEHLRQINALLPASKHIALP